MKITPSIQEFFNQQKVEIILFPTNQIRAFTKLESFIEFISKEKAFWDECETGNLNDVRKHFNQIYSWLGDADEAQSKINLQEALYLAQINRSPCIYSTTKEGKLFKKIYTQSSAQAEHAFNYLINGSAGNFSYDAFLGVMYAYNHRDKDKVNEKNINAEKEALSDLSTTFNDQLNELSTKFFSQSEEIKKEFTVVKEELKTGQKRFQSDSLALVNESKNRIRELENLYEEKLRLQGPAKYWKEVHDDYNSKGERWKWWSIKASIGFIAFLSAILYNAPQALFAQFNFNSVKATIVFALIASIGIYMIRFFVRLSTSAYHLSRDAYERYQLTHIYLSLWNAKAINESERNVVLQSLFSRADTGLLKGDSSPSFPGGVLDQLLKNMSK